MSLLFVFYQYIAKLDMVEKNTQYAHKIKLRLELVKEIVEAANQTQKVDKLCEYIRTIDTAVGITKYDRDIYHWIRELDTWVEGVPAALYDNPQDMTDAQKEQYSFTKDIKVWKMYTYDDGHSSSGQHFGDHIGFVNGLFKIPADLYKTTTSDELILTPVNRLVPDTDIELAELNRYHGVMNLDGFTMKEVAILNKMMNGNLRNTPFLIDQDIDLGLSEQKIRYIKISDDLNIQFDFNVTELKTVLFKYIRNHRVHEDAYEARQQMRYWLAQPGCETVEAHWWSHLTRRLVLPRPGFMRAAVPQMLAGEGVSTTLDALSQYKRDTHDFFLPVFESLFATTCWYWGEYLLIHNTKNMYGLLRNLKTPNNYELQDRERADALYSAVTGLPVKKCLYDQVSTFVLGGIESYYGITVRFGRLDLPHMEDLGYMLVNGRLNYGKVVTPGCTPLVVGLSGSLMLGTPYAAVFTINAAVGKDEYGIARTAYNYNDLWGMGVLARWNGYNLHYQHPKTDTAHRIYAANDVSIALPPVPPYKMKTAQSYRYLNMSQRERCFGADHEWAVDCHMILTWTRRSSQLLEEARWNAPYATASEPTYNIPNTLVTVPELVKQYQGMVTADYDYVTSGFRLIQTQAGVAMPGERKELDSLVVPPEEPPPLVPIAEVDSGQS